MRAWILVGIAALSGSILPAQPGRFTSGPGLSGDPHWRSPVATSAALPSTGNQPGDARLDLSTFALYVWDGNSWELPPGGGGGAPSGPAGGALAGTYPNPTLAANYAGSASAGGPATSAVSLTADLALGVSTSGGYAASVSEAGPATTATSLAADGTNCSTGEHPLGVDAAGNAQGCVAVSGGVTDHGALTGLSDDDHTQYAPLAGRSGTVPFTARLRLPVGSSSEPALSLGADDGTGLHRSGNVFVVTVGTSDAVHLAYQGVFLIRDTAQLLINDDSGIRREAAGKTAATCGVSGGTCTFVAKQYEIVAQASAPVCSTPAFYVNSAASNTLCYCNGSTWIIVPDTGPGPC